MGKGVAASILLLLSLEALLLFAAATSSSSSSGTGDVDVIRLPSYAALGAAAALVKGTAKQQQQQQQHQAAEKRPWDCCDLSVCDWRPPYTCGCLDRVERCSDNCKRCEEVEVDEGSPPRYSCADGYPGGDPGPFCDDQYGSRRRGALPDERTAAVVGGTSREQHAQERPWKCCDKAVRSPRTKETVWYWHGQAGQVHLRELLPAEGRQPQLLLPQLIRGQRPGAYISAHMSRS